MVMAAILFKRCRKPDALSTARSLPVSSVVLVRAIDFGSAPPF